MQEYAAKIQEWRKLRLESALAAESAAEAERLCPYAARAAAEVNAAHGWSAAFASADKSHPAYGAWCVLCRRLLAELAGETDLAASLAARYAETLREARVKDLSARLDEVCGNRAIPFVFAATGENAAVSQRTATMWKFSLAPSMVAKVEHAVSAVTVLTHKSLSDPNPYQLVLFAEKNGAWTLLGGSKNAAVPSTPGSLLTWHFDDLAVETGATLVCRFKRGFTAVFDDLAEEFADGPDANPSYTFPAQLSPVMSSTEFSGDANEFAYWDGTAGAHAGITACARLYKYSATATSLQSTAQKVMRRVFPFVANVRPGEQDIPLPFSIDAFANAVDAASLEAENETKRTVNSSSLDAVTSSAAEALACAKVAPVLGLGADFAQIRLQEYAAKIAEWRKLKLNETLEANSDPVLAELLANFANDDAALINAYEVYTRRSATAKEQALAEVKATLGMGSADEPDDLANAAAVCLAVASLALACGLGADFKQLKMQEYAAKIQEWRKIKLNGELADNSDPVLAELLANFKSDDAGLLNAYEVYSQRADTAKEAAGKEVKATLGIAANETLDDLAKAASDCLAAANLALACGLDANFKQLKMQEYAAKIQEWRKIKLNKALETEDDPLLAELLANFRSDDTALINAYTVYETRSALLKAEAEAETDAAHDWPTLADEGEAANLSALRAAAANARALEKLALATGAGEETARRYQAAAAEKLRAARAYALGHEAPPEGLAGEVAAVVRPLEDAGEAAMPYSLASIGRRVAELLPAARKEIMGAHRWNFARASQRIYAEPGCGGVALVPRPADCARVEAVRGPHGEAAEWSMRGGMVAVYGPVGEIVYIRDEPDEDTWPPAVRRALVYRLAADVAMPGKAGAEALQRLNALYERKLSDARVQDAREGNPGGTARGRKRGRLGGCYGGGEAEFASRNGRGW